MVLTKEGKFIISDSSAIDSIIDDELLNLKNGLDDLIMFFCYELEVDDVVIEGVDESDYTVGKHYISSMIKSVGKMIVVILETIGEYHVIMSAQTDIMSIDDYHEMRSLIKEYENRLMKGVNKLIKMLDTLTMIGRNLKKRRNSKDICKMLKSLEKLDKSEFEAPRPEEFIIEEGMFYDEKHEYGQ